VDVARLLGHAGVEGARHASLLTRLLAMKPPLRQEAVIALGRMLAPGGYGEAEKVNDTALDRIGLVKPYFKNFRGLVTSRDRAVQLGVALLSQRVAFKRQSV